VLAPPVDLGRGRRPEDIVEEYITKKTFLKWGSSQEKGTYEAALNVGDSTGGPRNACGNSLVLRVAR